MSTVLEQEVVATPTALSFPVQDFDINSLRPEVMALTKPDLDDAKAIKEVNAVRQRCVKMRTAIDKKKTEFAAIWIAGHKAVLAVAKSLQSELAPLEDHCDQIIAKLEEEKAAIEVARLDALYESRLQQWTEAGGHKTDRAYLLSYRDDEFVSVLDNVRIAAERQKQQDEANRIEKERLAKERADLEAAQAEANKRQQKITDRMSQLRDADSFQPVEMIADLTDDQFESVLQSAKDVQRVKAEQRQRQETLANRMREFAALRYFPDESEVERMTPAQFHDAKKAAREIFEEQQSAEAKRKAEEDRIAKETAEREQQEAIQKARDEGAEQSRLETEARLKRESEVAEQERQAEEARKAKEAALAPAKDKLNALCVAVMAIKLPEINHDADAKVHAARLAFIRAIGRIANELE